MAISKKNVVITLVINRETLRRVDALAEALEVPRSQFIRGSIDYCLEDFSFLSGLAEGDETLHRLGETLARMGYSRTDEHGRLVGEQVDFDRLLSRDDRIKKQVFGDEWEEDVKKEEADDE